MKPPCRYAKKPQFHTSKEDLIAFARTSTWYSLHVHLSQVRSRCLRQVQRCRFMLHL